MDKVWWGSFQFEIGQTGEWEIGPLRLALQRLAREWHVAYEQKSSPDDDPNTWQCNLSAPALKEIGLANATRYLFDQTGGALRLIPMLADRPVVTRPLTPFAVPPNETVTIYVSSPLWVSIEVGDPAKKLQEVLTRRPSDTWFGPSTIKGELGYASRTYGHINLENVPIRPHRAVTQVLIENKSDSQLLIERLSLPVPYLSLFATPEGQLWTQVVALTRTRDTGMAAFQISPQLPEAAIGAEEVSGPRQTPGANMVVRAFGRLFR
jgi:hypothetical protein